MQYVYPAIVIPLDEDHFKGYGVEFPDLDTATEGTDLYDALYMAEDLLDGVLTSLEDDGEEIPEPTPIKNVQVEGEAFVTLVRANTDAYRKYLAELEKQPKNESDDEEDYYISGWLANKIFKNLDITPPHE